MIAAIETTLGTVVGVAYRRGVGRLAFRTTGFPLGSTCPVLLQMIVAVEAVHILCPMSPRVYRPAAVSRMCRP